MQLKSPLWTGLPMEEKQALLDWLSEFLTENRRAKMREIVRHRTRHLTIVLEDIYQPHNASAVLRSCDCFGLLDVHIIENKNRYEVNPDIALGSSKWLRLFRYNKTPDNTAECLRKLKADGYRIVATSPHLNDYTPETLPLDQKTALVFGTEKEGLTEAALGMADDFVRIPMYGFTESLNISVSAALLLRSLTERLRVSDLPWQLNDEETLETLLEWTRNSVKNAALLEKKFLERN